MWEFGYLFRRDVLARVLGMGYMLGLELERGKG